MSNRVERLRELLAVPAIARAESQLHAPSEAPAWGYPHISGRLVEISGVGASASLTSAVGLVLEAQRSAEPVAWIKLPDSSFYPPDLADSGVDLDALVVVRVPGSQDAARAAERLVRSGGFGLLVLDLGRDARIATPLQGRLVSLAKRHDTAIVCLTARSSEAGSLGSMISLRAEAVRGRDDRGDRGQDARFCCKVEVLKDKCRGPGWSHREVVRGPAGLR